MTKEPLADLAIEAAMECAFVPTYALADLMVMLAQKGVVTSGEAREVVLRTEGVIRHFPEHSAARTTYEQFSARLAERLRWPPGSAPLRVDPLPPEAAP
jgi:hypothetical protein